MGHFLLGAGLGSGTAGCALLGTNSLWWAGIAGGLVLAVVWVAQNLTDREQQRPVRRDR
ncbi:hypothetical protein ABZ753_21625 [Streptomyces griseoincarnatus]